MKTYKFPSTLYSEVAAGQHYMLIDSYESHNAITSGTNISSIALYIPPNSLQTTYGANYEGLNSGALAGAVGTAAREVFEDKGGMSGNKIVAAVLAGAKSDTARAAGFSSVASKLVGRSPMGDLALGAGAGLAVNNHMALVYRGPREFRSHSFNFAFFPKSNPEAREVKAILEDFRNGMLPRYVGGGKTNNRLSSPFFKMPRHYILMIMGKDGENKQIDIFPRNNQDEQIKHVITGMSVNHDPNGVVSLHADGFPVQTNLSVTFQETEFITSKDTADDRYADSISANMTNQAQARHDWLGDFKTSPATGKGMVSRGGVGPQDKFGRIAR